MPIETIEFDGTDYPAIQATGFASRFSFALAKEFCKGFGYDIGCNRIEWALPNSQPIDPAIENCEYDVCNLPPLQVDYIFSSHMLEHVPDYVAVLNYWNMKLKYKGVLFMYLPNCNYQKYWNPVSNRKHVHHMSPDLIKKYFDAAASRKIWSNVTVGEGYDLNGSFYVIAEKK